MLVLSIETTSICASVALIEETHMHGEFTLDHPKTHSQKIMPMIDTLLKETGISIADVDAIAVANGPGSFTGIRIGLSTAKGLAQPFKMPIYEVPSLLGLAYNLFGNEALICPLLDARRDEVYTALYTFEGGKCVQLLKEQAVHPLKLGELIAPIQSEMQKKIIFLGDGAGKYSDVVANGLGNEWWEIAPVFQRMQRAASVGMVALTGGVEPKAYDAIDANYLRKSEAEETREAKNASQKNG